MKKKLIFDLFGGTGAWSQYYHRDPRYKVVMIDPRATRSKNDRQIDVQEFLEELRDLEKLPEVYGILGAFPCKQFALSGSRWWKEKDRLHPELIADAIDNAITLLRVVHTLKPKKFWCFENPVGRAPKLVPRLGRWKMTFNPHEFGGWLDPPGDAYTKRTCLWGDFNVPEKRVVEPVEGSRMHLMRPSKDRDLLRAITPSGFARAFYEANP